MGYVQMVYALIIIISDTQFKSDWESYQYHGHMSSA